MKYYVPPNFSEHIRDMYIGNQLFRLPTSVLGDFDASVTDVDDAFAKIGYKEPSDGMKYWDSVLYYGAVTESTNNMLWNISNFLSECVS
mmetsp:Transcript_24581/g.36200  ORF Transcript_24581/g.36200 Transcript_24581/m.36200 type:complete len:89 (+) Transcript_24581:501-767(+)